MARPKKLSPEDVERIRKNEEKWMNKEWAAHFGVSIVTIIHAKVGKLAYATTSEG